MRILDFRSIRLTPQERLGCFAGELWRTSVPQDVDQCELPRPRRVLLQRNGRSEACLRFDGPSSLRESECAQKMKLRVDGRFLYRARGGVDRRREIAL